MTTPSGRMSNGTKIQEDIQGIQMDIITRQEDIMLKNGMKIVAYLSCSTGRMHFARTNLQESFCNSNFYVF